jgi:transposase
MGRKRYPAEFEIEALKEVTEVGFSPYDMTGQLEATTNSLFNCIRKYRPDASDDQKASQESDEIRR